MGNQSYSFYSSVLSIDNLSHIFPGRTSYRKKNPSPQIKGNSFQPAPVKDSLGLPKPIPTPAARQPKPEPSLPLSLPSLQTTTSNFISFPSFLPPFRRHFLFDLEHKTTSATSLRRSLIRNSVIKTSFPPSSLPFAPFPSAGLLSLSPDSDPPIRAWASVHPVLIFLLPLLFQFETLFKVHWLEINNPHS